jgi:hypothetical protein
MRDGYQIFVCGEVPGARSEQAAKYGVTSLTGGGKQQMGCNLCARPGIAMGPCESTAQDLVSMSWRIQ